MTAYKKNYGSWAGNPEGRAPDYSKCCEEVWTRDRWSLGHQCAKKRGHGPEGAYCKQHDPAAAKARADASQAKWDKHIESRQYEGNGRRFYDALVQIAEGHNDACGLAQDIITKFKAGQ